MNWIAALVSVPIIFFLASLVLMLAVFRPMMPSLGSRPTLMRYAAMFLSGLSAVLAIRGCVAVLNYFDLPHGSVLLVVASLPILFSLYKRFAVARNPATVPAEVYDMDWRPDPDGSDEMNMHLRGKHFASMHAWSLLGALIGFGVSIFG